MLVATPDSRSTSPAWARSSRFWWRAWAAGLALALAATRRLIEPGRARRVLWLAAFAAGYALWLLGVYQKEASICALAALPFPLRRPRSPLALAGVVTGPLYRSRGFLIVAALLVLPLLHMMYEVTQVTAGGETVYGPTCRAASADGRSGCDTARISSGSSRGSSAHSCGLGVAAAAPFLLLAWAFGHRRVPWLPLGLLAAGLAVYLFQGLGGVPATRYFIPSRRSSPPRP